ncbi:MAG TPA: Rnf-Nqr domain containing protein [Spirochaetia bacterium]|nr:Rnf-Nqr domain containing protein [Spirochaetia bacterium]
MSWLGIILTFSLIDNIVLSWLLGICPCVGAPGGMRATVGTSAATGLLMSLSALGAWALNSLVLSPLGLDFLRTPAFVMTVACIAGLVDVAARRIVPELLRAAGIPLFGVAFNCATVGVALIATRGGFDALQSLVVGLAAGVGFFIALTLLTAIRERLEVEQAPPWLRGLPLHLISAGLLAYAFMAFDRAFLARLLQGW